MPYQAIRVLSFDLDDTLWPVAPMIAGAELELRRWLEQHAPATAAAFDALRMRSLRADIEREQPTLAHDLSALRLLTLRRAIEIAGEPAHLAQQAFDVFFAARQRVEFYPDVMPALQRLAQRYRLVSLSNGNADLHHVGLGHLFCGSVSAREVGCAKPDRRIFDAVCDRLGCEPSQVLHIGDHFEMDIAGARAAGLMAIWLRRHVDGSAPPADADDPAGCIADLDELVQRLGC
ncbi:HAD family hydrolase [Piscinibacter sakaiensis]|uniref:HAD family hydrolase n=1 Tax=Piscinibacter sakaiensis TaxID=1547922 RepID=UPI003AAA39C7